MNAVVEVGLWALRRRRRFRVTGASMEPTLSAGSFILVDPRRAPAVGDVVVADHPTKPLAIIKRVAAISAAARTDGGTVEVDLRSDNPDAGSDSRHFGLVQICDVRGVMTFVLPGPR